MLCLWSQTRGIVEKDHDGPMFDASDPDWQRAFKYFVANFQDFCIMEDFITPAKDETTEGNGCSTKGFSFSRMGCSYNYHRHSNLRRQQTKPCGVASRANKALPGRGADNPKYSPFSENSKVRDNYEYSRLANSSEAELSKMQLPNKGRGQASAWHFCYWSQWHLTSIFEVI